MKAGDRNAHLLAHKIAVLIKHGDVHIRNSDDFLDYLRFSNALTKLVGSEEAQSLVNARINELKEEPNG